MSGITRRQFFTGSGAVLALSTLPLKAELYPEIDLTYFDTPIPVAPGKIEIGYAAITWDGRDREAIEDIASVGYRGIQLRANILKEFGGKAADVRSLLARHHLTFVALSSGAIGADSTDEAAVFALHAENARFLHDAGGLYLQLTDGRPKGRPPAPDDYKRVGALMNRIARHAADLGIQVGYHNHVGSMGETPEGVAAMLAATDPQYVKLELDVAHYFQGGGDPAKAIQDYHDRLLFLHIKDVLQQAASPTSKDKFQFVELGQGRVDIPGVFHALDAVKFRGWAIVELDGERASHRTPKESAEMSRKYLEEKVGIRA